ncbi:30S ribosomal protein S8 [Candidatus Sumerlaeota bacterium]|nr:30S ribosomal protein S8 [Candidatus Sumerlaeota bacterium]
MLSDPIADMLTRIRNGVMAKKQYVDVPASKMKLGIARILQREGYIKMFKYLKDNRQGIIRVYLKYDENNEPAIHGLKRISKPGLRQYVNSRNIPRIVGGLGIAIISTSRGLKTDKECRIEKIGGEIICSVW